MSLSSFDTPEVGLGPLGRARSFKVLCYTWHGRQAGIELLPPCGAQSDPALWLLRQEWATSCLRSLFLPS